MTNSEIKQFILSMIAFLNSPDKWYQGYYASVSKDSTRMLSSLDPEATCWCLGGVIFKLNNVNEDYSGNSKIVRQYIEERIPDMRNGTNGSNKLVTWNDHESQTYENLIRTLQQIADGIGE